MRRDQKQLIFILIALLFIFFIIRSMGPTDAVTPVWQSFGKTAASKDGAAAEAAETAAETAADEASAAEEADSGSDTETAQTPASPADDTAPTEAVTAEYTFRTPELRLSHFTKHGIDMGFTTEEAYEEAASRVVTNPNALHKTEAGDGDDVYYIEDTNEFVVLSTDGYIRTYFNPDNGKAYFDKQ